MKSLKEQIRDGEFSKLYLFYGDEPYLIRLNAGRIKKALMTEEDEMMNFDLFRENIDTEALKISLETLPFMCERRLVFVENSGAFTSKAPESLTRELEHAAESLPDTTTVVFMEKDVDKRSRMFKAAQKYGQVLEMNHPGEQELGIWISQEFRRRNVRIDQNNISYFLSLTGGNMENILSEIQKLAGYVKEKGVVAREDIDLLVTPSVETKIFRLTDHLGSGRQDQAYLAYQELLRQNEKPEMIFYMICRQFHLLYRTSLMERESADTVAAELKLRPFVSREYKRQAGMFGRERLLKLVKKLYQFDLGFKTGEITVQEALDLVLLRYASLR